MSSATVKKSGKPMLGSLTLRKQESVEVVARDIEGFKGCSVIRNAKQQLAIVSTQDLQIQAEYLRFGVDLVVSRRGTGRRVPQLVTSCINHLKQYGLKEVGLFRVPGSAASIEEMQAAFERNEDPLSQPGANKTYTVESVAGLLKLFLRSLPNPVFPRKLYTTFITIGQLKAEEKRINELKETLSNYVPSAHVAVMQVLIPFLKLVAAESDVNKMKIDNLALVFGPTLLRAHSRTVEGEGSESNDMLAHEPAIKQLLATCIEHESDIFRSVEGLNTTVRSRLSTSGSEEAALPGLPEEGGSASEPSTPSAGLKSWDATRVKAWIDASTVSVSPEAKAIVGKLDGATLAAANKDTLRSLGITGAADLAKLGAMVYELSDPRAAQDR